jgi:hypothetical protein
MSLTTRTSLLKSVLPESSHLDSAIAQVVENQSALLSTEVPAELLQTTRLANSLADLSDGNSSIIKRVLDDPHVSTLRDVALRYNSAILKSIKQDAESAKTAPSLGAPKFAALHTITTASASSNDPAALKVASGDGQPGDEIPSSFDVTTFQRRLFHAEPSAVLQRMISDDHVGITAHFHEIDALIRHRLNCPQK